MKKKKVRNIVAKNFDKCEERENTYHYGNLEIEFGEKGIYVKQHWDCQYYSYKEIWKIECIFCESESEIDCFYIYLKDYSENYWEI